MTLKVVAVVGGGGGPAPTPPFVVSSISPVAGTDISTGATTHITINGTSLSGVEIVAFRKEAGNAFLYAIPKSAFTEHTAIKIRVPNPYSFDLEDSPVDMVLKSDLLGDLRIESNYQVIYEP